MTVLSARCRLGLVVMLATPLAAWAGPKEEVKAASAKFMAARSWQAQMDWTGPQPMRVQAEFQAPDRFRMRMPQGEQVLVGDTAWMTVGGRTLRVPLPAGTVTQWRQPTQWTRSVASMTVTAEGRETVDGVPARRYRLTGGSPPTTLTLWIGPDGYPVQLVTTASAGRGAPVTTTIRYSRFNDPAIRIPVPK